MAMWEVLRYKLKVLALLKNFVTSFMYCHLFLMTLFFIFSN